MNNLTTEKETMNYQLSHVSKVYEGNVKGLQELDLQIEGKRIGVLGEYGSGKSSLLNILATATKPSAGKVMFNGRDVVESSNELRSVLGFLPQNFEVYGTLTAKEYLCYIAALKKIDYRITQTAVTRSLEAVQCKGVNGEILGSLSAGMRQKIGIAQMLLTDPKVFVVDELSYELTAEERREILQLLGEQTKQKLLVIASEQADDFSGIVDEIVILSRGHIVMKTTPDEFIESVSGLVWELTAPSMNLSAIRRRYITTKTESTGEGIRFRCISEEQPSPTAKKVEPTLCDAYRYFLHKNRRTL